MDPFKSFILISFCNIEKVFDAILIIPMRWFITVHVIWHILIFKMNIPPEGTLFIFRGYVIFVMRDSDILNESNKNFCNAWNRKLFLKSFETLCVSEPAVSSQSRVRWPRSCSSLIEWNERMVGLKKSPFNGVHAQYSRKGSWQGE